MLKIFVYFIVALVLGSCGEEKDVSASPEIVPGYEPIFGTLYDARDGRTYKTTVINGLEWMAENLDYYVFYEHCYDNHLDIIDCKDEKYYLRAVNSECYEENPVNCKKYGRLYSWDVVIGDTTSFNELILLRNFDGPVQGICPEGWRVPTLNDFKEKLWYYLIERHPDLLSKEREALLKSADEWPDSLKGTNEYGFNLIPNGYFSTAYYKLGECASFWLMDEFNEHLAYRADFGCWGGLIDAINKYQQCALRCVRNYPSGDTNE